MTGTAPLPASRRTTASLWLRPIVLTLGGLALAVLLALVDQVLAAVLVAAFALLMGYWTSPLRSGPHTPYADAITRRAPDHAIILWAPGDALSARLQTAIRGHRPDVTWVNIRRDPDAEAFLLAAGGHGALPVVVIGERILRRASVGDVLDARAEAQRQR